MSIAKRVSVVYPRFVQYPQLYQYHSISLSVTCHSYYILSTIFRDTTVFICPPTLPFVSYSKHSAYPSGSSAEAEINSMKASPRTLLTELPLA